MSAARYMLRLRPLGIAGVTTQADAQAFASAGTEYGYGLAFVLRGNDQGCSGFSDDPVWNPPIRMAVGAGKSWLGAFAGFVNNPDNPIVAGGTEVHDRTLVSAWLLLPSPEKSASMA